MIFTPNLFQLPGRLLTIAAIAVLMLAGCAPAEPPLSYQIEVQTAQGDPIAGASVTANIGVRLAVEGTTNAEGVAQLAIDRQYLELDHWAKITVDADDFESTSTLVELQEDGSTVVSLGDDAAASSNNNGDAAAGETEAETADEETAPEADMDAEAESVADLPPPDPGPLAELPAEERTNYYDARPEMAIDSSENYRAIIKTSKGDILLSLDAEAAPEHVNNFVFLSNQGFYDGLTFHRVEPGFVIQGGDPQASGQGGPGYTIPGEFDLKHVEGALAMARLPDQINPDRESSGSQFYITLAPTPALDNEYSVFGQVESGMDVVQSIEVGDTIDRIIIQP